MRSAILSRLAIIGGTLAVALVVALSLSAAPANAGTYTPVAGVATVASGGSATGGQGTAYTWKVYGNGYYASSGYSTSPAWKSFVNTTYKPCGTNCRNDFAGRGSYNWTGIAPQCKTSAYIWAKVLNIGYINQHGYAQHPSSVAKYLPARAASGSRNYAGFRAEFVYYLTHRVPSRDVYIVLLCSGGLG